MQGTSPFERKKLGVMFLWVLKSFELETTYFENCLNLKKSNSYNLPYKWILKGKSVYGKDKNVHVPIFIVIFPGYFYEVWKQEDMNFKITIAIFYGL